MKSFLNLLAGIGFCFHVFSAAAQLGGGPSRGPAFGGDLTKLFGENSAFTADLEMQTKGGPTEDKMTIPGKIAFDNGKTRFDIDVSQMQGTAMPPGTAAQMKALGMEKMVSISRPDKKVGYTIYPGLESYVEMPVQDAKTGTQPSDYKLETTELGKETVEGHACVKAKAVVTDKQGRRHESMVWNASDLKKFPVKIEMAEGGVQVTMRFKNVKLEKPEATQFEPPSVFKKYDNPSTMMQQSMMKRLGAGQGAPPSGQKP